jgi:phosphatidylglycerophosphate synthase
MNITQAFAGDRKTGAWLLARHENRFKNWAVPRLPKSVETWHLTLTTILWSLGNIILAFFARENLTLLWLVSLMIVLQYITDLFDGELGRQRNTGLVKWGFHMDHFLDYVFLCSMAFVGFMIAPVGLSGWYFALLAILGGYMVNSFLRFAATNEFVISRYGIGPTEFRVLLILINGWIAVMGTVWFEALLPAVVILCFVGLVINTWEIQQLLWRMDMFAKAETQSES